MNELKIFQNKDFGQIRTSLVNNEPMFCLADVCRVLELSNSRSVADRLDEDERCKLDLPRQGETWFINESGLYTTILRSDKPQAKSFRKWVTSEVLPDIRKRGAYMTDSKIEEVLMNPDTIIQLATQLKIEREQRKLFESKVEQDKPKVLFADSVSASKTSILVGELAKLLRQNGVDIGQNRLFEKLRKDGYLIKRKGTDWNMPTQYSMNLGLFEIKEHSHLDSNGNNITTKTAKVTGKGQIYFINKFIEEAC